MLVTIYTFAAVIVFIGLTIWTLKKVSQSNKRLDEAYIAHYNKLVSTLPPSDVFPAILQAISFPGVGSGSSLSNRRDNIGIIYMKDGKVITELVGTDKVEPFYKVYPQIQSPAALLEFRSSEPETSFPGKGSYVLQTVDSHGKLCLIGQFVNTPKDIQVDEDILKWHKNQSGQQAIFEGLVKRGVNIRPQA